MEIYGKSRTLDTVKKNIAMKILLNQTILYKTRILLKFDFAVLILRHHILHLNHYNL